VLALLQAGTPARVLLKKLEPEDLETLQGLNLLTSHPVLYVCNVIESEAASGNAHTKAVEKMAAGQGAGCVTISANIEAEVAQLPDADAKEFLADLGLEEPGLDKLIHEGYKLLGLITYFTVGPKEARAWTVHKGAKAPQAAGVIHTDFERGFIRAQTIAYDDFVSLGGEVPAKEAGKARDEGKEYVVQDGDVMLFKFNT
jgi:ribosome-binding ATPase